MESTHKLVSAGQPYIERFKKKQQKSHLEIASHRNVDTKSLREMMR